MKYPLELQNFEQIIQGEYVYADKTALVYELTTTGKYYLLCRPRGFGKSLLVSTFENYFLGRKELFKGLAIENLEKEWIEYPVFRIDFNDYDLDSGEALENVIAGHVEKWEAVYGKSTSTDNLCLRFAHLLQEAHRRTGRRAVVLVDGYEKPFLDCGLSEDTRRTLNALYGVFEYADEHLHFVFLAGVMKPSGLEVYDKVSDISTYYKCDTICGITNDELLTTFRESVENLSKRPWHEEEFDVTVDKLRKWCGGYRFSHNMVETFNPYSLLNILKKMEYEPYGFALGCPSHIVSLLEKFDANLYDIAGEEYHHDSFTHSVSEAYQLLPTLYHNGYLTMKEHDRQLGTYILDFPNEEVSGMFREILASRHFQLNSVDTKRNIEKIAWSMEDDRRTEIKESLEKLFAPASQHIQQLFNSSNHGRVFHYTFFLMMQFIGRYEKVEVKMEDERRIDYVVECENYVYILGVRLDGSAEDALNEIKEKGYAEPYTESNRGIIAIGANLSSETGTIDGFESKELKYRRYC